MPNFNRNNILLTKNDFPKEALSYSNNNNNNNFNLLSIYKNNMIKRKKKDYINEELFDNSKNGSISSSSYSLNFYNEKKYNNNNKTVNSISNHTKSNNIYSNQNRSIEIINSYKTSKDKYSYIFNKKISNNNLKINNTSKNQNSIRIDSYPKKGTSNQKDKNNSKNKYDKKEGKLKRININFNNRYIIEKKQQYLTPKQKGYILLCESPILRLKEQIILSRNPLIKNSISIEDILKNHEKILNNKLKELNEEVELCINKLNKPFIASKIADVTLNFITSLDEQEFEDFDLYSNDENEIKLYYNFIKILYLLLLDEPFDKNNDNKKIKNELFLKIKKKGFQSLKDYLYFIYISNKKKIIALKNVEFINEIIKNEPDIINNNVLFRMCRFMAFSIFLIREILNYIINIRDTIELKIRTKQFMGIVIEKLNKVKIRNNTNTIKISV